MSQPLIAQAQRFPEPCAGDICRLRDRDGLWMPYEAIGGRSDGSTTRFHVWLFAHYPKFDSVRTIPLSHVDAIVYPCGSAESRAFWKLVTGKDPV